ncbi:MAG: hypothetical protein J7L16_03865 [Deltaproteobacteria bacterium]|nr:hypothetical protein [Deltaproteobacteria bacterium]
MKYSKTVLQLVIYYTWKDGRNRDDLLNKGCFVGPQPMWRRNIHDEYGYFNDSFVSSGDYEFFSRSRAPARECIPCGVPM